MFNTNLNIKVVAATGLGNEILVKPRQGKKLMFAGQPKHSRLTQELKDSFDRYNSVLPKTHGLFWFLHEHRLMTSTEELAKLIVPSATASDRFLSEFKYRLEWLVQLGLLDRPSSGYAISVVGDALIGIARTKTRLIRCLQMRCAKAVRLIMLSA